MEDAMNKEPVKFIIPRIHKLNDCYFIQWNGNEYYLRKNIVRESIGKIFTKYFLIDFLLMMLILIISDIFPVRNIQDILRLLLLPVVTGIQSGIAVIKDREESNNR